MSVRRKAIKAVPVGEVQIPGTSVTLPTRVGVVHPLVPEKDPNYVFRAQYVAELAYAVKYRQNCLLVGDAGVGKSSLVEQVAAHVNQPLRRVNCHGESDTTLFVGRDRPTECNGVRKLVYEPGILAEAMTEGFWLLLDELDAALQPVLFVLQQVLEDGGKLMLEDGQGTVVTKHPDFRLFATANTVGIASRNRLLYSGTMGRLNEATLDRFAVVSHVEPMDPKMEVALITSKVPDLQPAFIEALVKIANETRAQLKQEQLSCTFSTRRLLQWAQAMREFMPVHAARLTVLNKLNADDYKVLEGVIKRFFGED
jgi:cobaltochelatase CobS